MSSETESIEFDKTFDKILSALTPASSDTTGAAHELIEPIEWLKQCLVYNVPHGKRNRGLACVQTYRIIAEQRGVEPSDGDMELARILGWTVEILQAFFLIVDDMMDQSVTRRGQSCWYKLPYVGLMSCNDSIMVDQHMYRVLRLYFSDKPYYQKIVDLYHEISRCTGFGQCMDTASNPPDKRPQFELFSQRRYDTIVKYKTSLYSFVLPVRLAMYMSGIDLESEHKYAEDILLKIGHLFQVQDDYLDCFGDPDVIGKIGTDIEEGKCCWPIVQAFRVCNRDQRATLEANYGLKDGDSVAKVKDIYRGLGVKEMFADEEERYYKEICVAIEG
ncbi:unnamed protein product, partial [Oppiella nova]